jgi:hypothetical protein
MELGHEEDAVRDANHDHQWRNQGHNNGQIEPKETDNTNRPKNRYCNDQVTNENNFE